MLRLSLILWCCSACTVDIPHGLWLRDAARQDARRGDARPELAGDSRSDRKLADRSSDSAVPDRSGFDRPSDKPVSLAELEARMACGARKA